MKKILLTIALVLGIIASFYLWGMTVGDHVLAGGRVQSQPNYIDGTATSTVKYYTTSTATTTMIFSAGGAEGIDANICATASSSLSNMVSQRLFAFENTDNPTWFEETTETITSANGLTITAGPFRILSLATTTETYRCYNLNIAPNRAKMVRIDFRLTGGNAGIWRMPSPLIGL